MSQHDNDNEFNDDRLSQLYKKSATETPSEKIKQQLLLAAKQQAESYRSGWNLFEYLLKLMSSSRSLAFAAVMVIGISIILQIQFDQPDELTPTFLDDAANGRLPAEAASPEVSLSAEPTQESEEATTQAITRKNSTAPPASISPAKSPAADFFKSESEERHTQQQKEKRLKEQQRKQEERKKQRLMLSPESQSTQSRPQALYDASSMATVLPDCKTLSDIDCLSSSRCLLVNEDDVLICRETVNLCEENFIQKNNAGAEQCRNQQACEFIAGDCVCKQDGSCKCTDNKPPLCQPIQLNQ